MKPAAVHLSGNRLTGQRGVCKSMRQKRNKVPTLGSILHIREEGLRPVGGWRFEVGGNQEKAYGARRTAKGKGYGAWGRGPAARWRLEAWGRGHEIKAYGNQRTAYGEGQRGCSPKSFTIDDFGLTIEKQNPTSHPLPLLNRTSQILSSISSAVQS